MSENKMEYMASITYLDSATLYMIVAKTQMPISIFICFEGGFLRSSIIR